MNKVLEARINKLLKELPPAEGDASNLARELTRAISQLNHHYYNGGERLGIGKGKQTCSPAGMFIAIETNAKISNTIREVWISKDERSYEQKLAKVTKMVLDYIETHPELKSHRYYALWEYKPPFSNHNSDHK